MSGAIFIDGATFFTAALIFAFIIINGDTMKNESANLRVYTAEFVEVIKFMVQRRAIFITALLFGLVNFCLSPMNILMPALIKDILKSGPEAMSIIEITFSIGSMVGVLLLVNSAPDLSSLHCLPMYLS